MIQDSFETMNLALEMILIFDTSGRIMFGNTRAQKLLEYDQLEDLQIQEIFPDILVTEDGDFTWKESEQDLGSEQNAYRKNKTCFSVLARISKVNSERQKLYICMALDNTIQNYFAHRAQMADEQNQSAQQMKSQFVATVTHELRTPVNGILGNVQTLMGMENDPAKQGLLALMERGCRDMHAIINNILDFSKLDAGKLELDEKEFVLRDLMDYIKSNHINKITDKGLGFFMNISPEVPEKVIGDELRIGQVLNNFLSNATKFTATGKIMVEVVKTAQMGDRVELFFMVMDTGIGISKENQDKLFKSFSQVDSSTFRKYGGTGLGLSICKQLVEMMGGNVHVESEENKGSVFSFHIWIKVPTEEGEVLDTDMHAYQVQIPTMDMLEDTSKSMQYGTEENREELQKKLSKLILCIEMKNWEKAEMFMEGIRQLTNEAPREVKSLSLRLKMSVQKEDYEKALEAYNLFAESLEKGESIE